MGILENQLRNVQKRIHMVNMLRSVMDFSETQLADPEDFDGVAKEIKPKIFNALNALIQQVEVGGASSATPPDNTTPEIKSDNKNIASANNAEAPQQSTGVKQAIEFAQRYRHLENKTFSLKVAEGTIEKAVVVGLAPPYVLVKLVNKGDVLKVPPEIVESGE